FVNMSGDPNIEYICDGISEAVIRRLSQIPSLTVRPPSSGLRYKGKLTTPQTVAKELLVQAVLFGRVKQQGESLIVSVELVDAKNNRMLWGETYNRKLSEALDTERDIALEICDRLHQQLSRAQQLQVQKSPTTNPEAYQSYLKGRFYWEERTPDALQQARDYFNQAIAGDPTFAQAYVGLADYWAVAPDYLSVSV